jgi:hypothetical protein
MIYNYLEFIYALSMVDCLDDQDLRALSLESLRSFDDQVASIPQDACAPFYVVAGRLESELLVFYRMVVLCAKKEEDLDKVAQWWGGMVSLCDEFAVRLETLIAQHPYCGVEIYRDRFLDVRNTCKRLQNLHA